MSDTRETITLGAGSCPAWLTDHRIHGRTVVPAAVSAIWMARRLETGLLVDVRWLRPLHVADEAISLRLEVFDEVEVALTGPRSGPAGPFGRACYARAVRASGPTAGLSSFAPIDATPSAPPGSFHGPFWRATSTTMRASEEGLDLSGSFAVLTSESEVPPGPPATGDWDPRALDWCFQAVGAWERSRGTTPTWPARADAIRWLAAPRPREVLEARARRSGAASASGSGAAPGWDVVLQGEDDRRLIELSGYQTGAVPRGWTES